MSEGQSSQLVTIRRQQSNSGILYCFCGEVAPVRISRTELNPGKPFYGCHLPRKHVANCGFFRWVEDVKGVITPGQIGGTMGNQLECAQIDEQVMLLKELVGKGVIINEELKDVGLKVEFLIEEIRMLKEGSMNKDTFVQEMKLLNEVMLKNETFVQEMKMMRGLVLGLGMAVVFVLMVLVYVVIA